MISSTTALPLQDIPIVPQSERLSFQSAVESFTVPEKRGNPRVVRYR